MKFFGKFLMLALVISMISVPAAFATEQSGTPPFDVVKAKKELAQKYKSENAKSLTKEQKDKRNKEVQLILNSAAAGETLADEARTKLEKMKVHKLEMPKEEAGISIMSQPNDIQMNAVDIYYDSYANTWHVTGGGWWKNDNWASDSPYFSNPSVGAEKNMGQRDLVGIAFYSTSGTTPTSSSSMGYWTNQSGWNDSSTSPSHGNSSSGVAFEYQDKVRVVSLNPTKGTYLGKGFSATMTFDSDFADFNGKARSFHSHTWSQTYISAVSLNVSTSPGFSVTFANGGDGYSVYNNSDTNF